MEAAKGVPPDGGWGWVIVFASFIGFVISAGLVNSFSVLYVAFLDAFGESKAVTAWISGIFDVAFVISTSYGVAFSKRFGHRKTVMAAGVLTSLGILTSGFTIHVYQLYFTYGVLTGAGMGLAYVTCIEIVSIHFKKRFPIAIGLAMAGSGAGQFVLSVVTQMMVDRYGWRGMLLIMSAFTLHLCVAGALMRPLGANRQSAKHRSPDMGLQRSQKDEVCNKKIFITEENDSKDEDSTESYEMIRETSKTVLQKPKTTFARCFKSYFLSIYDISLFQEPVFITFCIIGIGQVFGTNSTAVHLVRRARDFGIADSFGAYIPAVMGLVQLIGRPCFGAAGQI
ncbi:monocarboxylate transporter 12-like [Ptychodera flava]|uniref:monocarboxylate transporter 12-like n=1 Tax=Ptychodera flava TaxID=63121 RepID=UPI00396A5BF1